MGEEKERGRDKKREGERGREGTQRGKEDSYNRWVVHYLRMKIRYYGVVFFIVISCCFGEKRC